MTDLSEVLLGSPSDCQAAKINATPSQNLMDADIPAMVASRCIVSDLDDDTGFGQDGGKVTVICIETMRTLQRLQSTVAPVAVLSDKRPFGKLSQGVQDMFGEYNSGDPASNTTSEAEADQHRISNNTVGEQSTSDQMMHARQGVMSDNRKRAKSDSPQVWGDGDVSMIAASELQKQSAIEHATDTVYVANKDDMPMFVVSETAMTAMTTTPDVIFKEMTRRDAIELGLVPEPNVASYGSSDEEESDDEDVASEFDVLQALRQKGFNVADADERKHIDEEEDPQFQPRPEDNTKTLRMKQVRQNEHIDMIRQHNLLVDFYEVQQEQKKSGIEQEINDIVTEYRQVKGAFPPNEYYLYFVTRYSFVAEMLKEKYGITFTQDEVDKFAKLTTYEKQEDGFDNLRDVNILIANLLLEIQTCVDEDGDIVPDKATRFSMLHKNLVHFTEVAKNEIKVARERLEKRRGLKNSGQYLAATVADNKAIDTLMNDLDKNINRSTSSFKTQSSVTPASVIATVMFKIPIDIYGWKNDYIDKCNELYEKRIAVGTTGLRDIETQWNQNYQLYTETAAAHKELLNTYKEHAEDTQQKRRSLKATQLELTKKVHTLHTDIDALQKRRPNLCNEDLLHERRCLRESKEDGGVVTLSDDVARRLHPESGRLEQIDIALEECDEIDREITEKLAQQTHAKHELTTLTQLIQQYNDELSGYRAKIQSGTRERRVGEYDPEKRKARMQKEEEFKQRTEQTRGMISTKTLALQHDEEHGAQALKQALAAAEVIRSKTALWNRHKKEYNDEMEKLMNDANKKYEDANNQSRSLRKRATEEISSYGTAFQSAIIQLAWDATAFEEQAYQAYKSGTNSVVGTKREDAQNALNACMIRRKTATEESRTFVKSYGPLLTVYNTYMEVLREKNKQEFLDGYQDAVEKRVEDLLSKLKENLPSIVVDGVFQEQVYKSIDEEKTRLKKRNQELKEEFEANETKLNDAIINEAQDRLAVMKVNRGIFDLVYAPYDSTTESSAANHSKSDIKKAQQILDTLFSAGVKRANAESYRLKVQNINTYMPRNITAEVFAEIGGNERLVKLAQQHARSIRERDNARKRVQSNAHKAALKTNVPDDFVGSMVNVLYGDDCTTEHCVKFKISLQNEIAKKMVIDSSTDDTQVVSMSIALQVANRVSKRHTKADLTVHSQGKMPMDTGGSSSTTVADNVVAFDNNAFRHELYDELVEEIRMFSVHGSSRAAHYYMLLCNQLQLMKSKEDRDPPYTTMADMDCSQPAPEMANFLRVSWQAIDEYNPPPGYPHHANNVKYILVQWAAVPMERRAGSMPPTPYLDEILRLDIVCKDSDPVIDPITRELMVVTSADRRLNEYINGTEMHYYSLSAPLSHIKRTPVTWANIGTRENPYNVPINDAMNVFRLLPNEHKFKLHLTQSEAETHFDTSSSNSVAQEAQARELWTQAKMWGGGVAKPGYRGIDVKDFDGAMYEALWKALDDFETHTYAFNEINRQIDESSSIVSKIKSDRIDAARATTYFAEDTKAMKDAVEKGGGDLGQDQTDDESGEEETLFLNASTSESAVSMVIQNEQIKLRLTKQRAAVEIRLAQSRGISRYGITPTHTLTTEQKSVLSSIKGLALESFDMKSLKSVTDGIEQHEPDPSASALNNVEWLQDRPKFELARKAFNSFISRYYPWERLVQSNEEAYMLQCVEWMSKLRQFKYPHLVLTLPDMRYVVQTHPHTDERTWVIFLGPSLNEQAPFSPQNRSYMESIPDRYQYANSWDTQYIPAPSLRPLPEEFVRRDISRFGSQQQTKLENLIQCSKKADNLQWSGITDRLDEERQRQTQKGLALSKKEELEITRNARRQRVADTQLDSEREFHGTDPMSLINPIVSLRWVSVGTQGTFTGPLSQFPTWDSDAVRALTLQSSSKYTLVMRSVEDTSDGAGRMANLVLTKNPPQYIEDETTRAVAIDFPEAESTKEYTEWATNEMKRKQSLRIAHSKATGLIEMVPSSSSQADVGSSLSTIVPQNGRVPTPNTHNGTDYDHDDVLEYNIEREESLMLDKIDSMLSAAHAKLPDIDANSLKIHLDTCDPGPLRLPTDALGFPVRPLRLPELLLV